MILISIVSVIFVRTFHYLIGVDNNVMKFLNDSILHMVWEDC